MDNIQRAMGTMLIEARKYTSCEEDARDLAQDATVRCCKFAHGSINWDTCPSRLLRLFVRQSARMSYKTFRTGTHRDLYADGILYGAADTRESKRRMRNASDRLCKGVGLSQRFGAMLADASGLYAWYLATYPDAIRTRPAVSVIAKYLETTTYKLRQLALTLKDIERA